VNLTKSISPAYSLSGSIVTSDTEDLAVKMASAPKTPTKARRTDLVPKNAAKLLKARKSKVTVNKEFTPKKKKDVLKERKFLANNNAAERFSSAIVKAKIEHASVGSRALMTALKSKKLELKAALTFKASKTTKKRSEAERALKDVYEYLSERFSAYETNKAATKPVIEQLIPDKINLAEIKLKMAEKRAFKVKTRMKSAIQETDMAKYDVAVMSERLRVAKRRIYTSKRRKCCDERRIPELQGAHIGYETA